MATESDDKVQLFVVIDNEVVAETDSYLSGHFCFFGAQHVFNLEFNKSQTVLQISRGICLWHSSKKKTQYRYGVAKLVS